MRLREKGKREKIMRVTKNEQRQIFAKAIETFGSDAEVTKSALDSVAQSLGREKIGSSWIKDARVRHGVYSLQTVAQMYGIVGTSATDPVDEPNVVNFPNHSQPRQQTVMAQYEGSLIPEKDKLFVTTDSYNTLKRVVDSGVFYPVFITGQSGNGKSLSVIQACANAGRELIRINVTSATDGDDLLGHYGLISNAGGAAETVWIDGPVVQAMKRGAVVLIDEIDMLANNKVGELFSILEGKGVFLKKINTLVTPEPGFNIIATANTKGQGNDDGRYLGTNVLNEAFLERFPITLEYEYPGKGTEKKILTKVFKSFNLDSDDDTKFCKDLVDWASIIRKSYEEGATEEIITTRRLVNIVKAYSIFGDRVQALRLSIARFSTEVQESFIDLFDKISGGEITTDDDGNQTAVAGSIGDHSEF